VANSIARQNAPEYALKRLSLLKRPLSGVGFLCAAALVLLGLAGEGRSSESVWDEIYKSAWSGIYTNDQAARGQSSYRSYCASCHGASLEGSGDAPPLAGPDFVDDWDCGNIADLFEKIEYTMPANRPGRLGEGQIAEILSYILKVNRFPAGKNALPPDVDGLRGLLFFAQNPNRQ
jgi:S-disulfanyl-L-cysteine oxidoreductase SoxD